MSTTIQGSTVEEIEKQGYVVGPEVNQRDAGTADIITAVGNKYYSDKSKVAASVPDRSGF